MAYVESNGHVTDDVTHVTPKGQTHAARDNKLMLRAHRSSSGLVI